MIRTSSVYISHMLICDLFSFHRYEFDPISVNVPRCTIEDLRGDDVDENVREFRDVLRAGEYTNAKRDAVILNAGFGVYVYGLTSSIEDGIELARRTLYTGKASALLSQWADVTTKIAASKI